MRMDTQDGTGHTAAAPANEDPPEALELDRVALRLDGFEMYSFLASMIAGFTYGCLTEIDVLQELNQKLPSHIAACLAFAFSFNTMLSIQCGIYSTCVFALCSLSKHPPAHC